MPYLFETTEKQVKQVGTYFIGKTSTNGKASRYGIGLTLLLLLFPNGLIEKAFLPISAYGISQ